GTFFFTHPKDTGGQLEFVGVEGAPLGMDPRADADWSPPAPSESPLTLVGVSHFTTGARDLDRLESFYAPALDAPPLHRTPTSVFVRVGTESIVELAAPDGQDSLLARDVEANGELPHGVTFLVEDLDAAERHAGSVGVRARSRSGDTLVLEPDD